MEDQAIYDAPVATRPQQKQALVEVEDQRAIAEVKGAIVLAKQFPRNQIEAMDRIITACQRPGLAEQALYSYARGGTEITGPSIWLAEAIAQNWSNLQFGIRELEQRVSESTVESFCWDVETNVRQVKTFQVKHERFTKKGKYSLEDPRDIYETVASQGARRLRACILGIIPGDVVEAAVNQCEQTLKAKADTSPEALKKLVSTFEELGVSREQIEKRIQRRLDSMTAAQLVQLRKIYNSLKDGMSSPTNWFEVVGDTPKTGDRIDNLKERIKKGRPQKGKKVVPQPESTLQASEMAPATCPNQPETTYTKEYCDDCPERPGCPVWKAYDNDKQ